MLIRKHGYTLGNKVACLKDLKLKITVPVEFLL